MSRGGSALQSTGIAGLIAGFCTGASLAIAAPPARAAAVAPLKLPPSPYAILGTRQLETPTIDAIPLCVPVDLGTDLHEIARMAAAGDLEPALELYRQRSSEGQVSTPEESQFAASLAARHAGDREARLTARRVLRAAIDLGGSDAARACSHLEGARLDLALRRFPEAPAAAVRAERLAKGPAAAKFNEAARFYRAEALYLSGWGGQAETLYRELAGSETPAIAAAARLRIADVAFDGGNHDKVLQDYETLLKRASAFGARLEGWVLRTSESALAAGRYAAAATWAERIFDLTDSDVSPQANAARAAVAVRIADVEAFQGDGVASRKRLVSVAKRFEDSPLGLLADVRSIALGVDSSPLPERLERLRGAADSRHRGVALYALGVLGHELRERNRLDEALSVLTRLSYEAPPEWLTPHLAEDIAALLQEVAARSQDDGDCLTYVRRIGGRYPLLAHGDTRADPLLRLGTCYEQLGLPAIAMNVYRSLVRASGGKLAERVALPLARTALANRDLGLVRTAAAGHVRRTRRDRAAWLFLLAQAELLDGRHARAASLLRDLVRNHEPRGTRLATLLALARAVVRLPISKSDRILLTLGLEALPESERSADRLGYGEALLLAAELQRWSGNPSKARRFYAEAGTFLPPGSMRSETLYWAGALASDADMALLPWTQASEGDSEVAWRRLAEFEVAMVPLRGQLGAWPPAANRSDADGSGGKLRP